MFEHHPTAPDGTVKAVGPRPPDLTGHIFSQGLLKVPGRSEADIQAGLAKPRPNKPEAPRPPPRLPRRRRE
jgi:hypothetical protein